jgi:predicted ester cyclase
MTTPNKTTVRAYVDAFNRGDFDRLRALFGADAVVYGVNGFGSVDKVMPIWHDLHHGLAMELTVEDMVEDGNVVAVRYTERGRWIGPFMGHDKPTGRRYEMAAMEWFELAGGRIGRRWGARDAATQARQVGF